MSRARNIEVVHKVEPMIKLTLFDGNTSLGTILFKRGNLTIAMRALQQHPAFAGAANDMIIEHHDGAPAVQIADNDVMSVTLLNTHSAACTEITSVFVYYKKNGLRVPVASVYLINTMQYVHQYTAMHVKGLSEVGLHIARRFEATQRLLTHNVNNILATAARPAQSLSIMVKPRVLSIANGERGAFTNVSAFAFDTFNAKNSELIDSIASCCRKVNLSTLQASLAVAALVLAKDKTSTTFKARKQPTVLCLPYMTTMDAKALQKIEAEHPNYQRQRFAKMTLKLYDAPFSSWASHVLRAGKPQARYVMWHGCNGTVVLLHLRATAAEYEQRSNMFRSFIQRAFEPVLSES